MKECNCGYRASAIPTAVATQTLHAPVDGSPNCLDLSHMPWQQAGIFREMLEVRMHSSRWGKSEESKSRVLCFGSP